MPTTLYNMAEGIVAILFAASAFFGFRGARRSGAAALAALVVAAALGWMIFNGVLLAGRRGHALVGSDLVEGTCEACASAFAIVFARTARRENRISGVVIGVVVGGGMALMVLARIGLHLLFFLMVR